MAVYRINEETLVAMANSIRSATGRTGEILVENMSAVIEDGITLPELANEGISADLLSGKQLIDSDGNVVEGSMKDNGAISKTMDGINTKSVTVPVGYTSGGTISLTDDIDNEVVIQADLLAQVQTALEGKAAGGSGIELPALINEGTSADLLLGKQLINSKGNVVEGTIETKTASNLTTSEATVTVPAGYYATQATKSVSTTTQATPSISVSSSGLITASATQTAGYVAADTKSTTKQLTTQAAKTVTPSTSSQTAVASGRYTTGAITVAAIPSNYEDVGTETTTYTTELAELQTKITALEAALEGKAIGTATVYNGTAEPDASVGSDGDIYLVVSE